MSTHGYGLFKNLDIGLLARICELGMKDLHEVGAEGLDVSEDTIGLELRVSSL